MINFLRMLLAHNFRAGIWVTSLYIAGLVSPLQAQPIYQEVKIPSEFGFTNDALYFPAPGPKAVILVHQSSAHKESWLDLARQLQSRGITALSLEDVGRRPVLDAIKYLSGHNYSEVMLVGASIGGGAVLQASAQAQGSVTRVVLLSTSSAAAIINPNINKLFITSKSDMWGSDSFSIFEEANEPKQIIEYDGFAHGQDLLTGKDGKEITTIIVDFLLAQ